MSKWLYDSDLYIFKVDKQNNIVVLRILFLQDSSSRIWNPIYIGVLNFEMLFVKFKCKITDVS